MIVVFFTVAFKFQRKSEDTNYPLKFGYYRRRITTIDNERSVVHTQKHKVTVLKIVRINMPVWVNLEKSNPIMELVGWTVRYMNMSFWIYTGFTRPYSFRLNIFIYKSILITFQSVYLSSIYLSIYLSSIYLSIFLSANL